MNKKIIIGSRGSDLALWQANYVKDQLSKLQLQSEISIIKTKGDLIKDLSFDKIEGKGFFTKEIEDALLNNSIDLAVHSHKDLETNPPKGLVVAAVSEREDPSELLLIRKDRVVTNNFWSLKHGAVVGTSSSRRKSQLKLFRDDLFVKDLRGNVPTRIQKLRNREYDAIVIASAGVLRLQLDITDLHSEKLPVKWFIPAPAQGVLGIQVRETDSYLIKTLQKINSPSTQRNIEFERKVLNLMDGGCQLPLGVYCEYENNSNKIWASMSSADDEVPYRLYREDCSPHEVVDQLLLKNSKKQNIFITRELKKESLFNKILTSKGHEIKGESLIEIEYLKTELPNSFDWLFFTSSNAVSSFKDHLSKIKACKIGAIGISTANELLQNGFKVDFIGRSEPDKVADDFACFIGDQKVLFPISDKSVRTIQKKLNSNQVLEIVTYKNKYQPKKLNKFDVLVFTSPSNVSSFFSINEITNEKVIAIGSSTEKALINNGVSNVLVSWEASEIALADTILSLS